MAHQFPKKILASLGKIINRQTGLVVPDDRRHGLEEGIVTISRRFGFRDPDTCLDWLVKTDQLNVAQIEILADHITIGETYFYREPRVFEILGTEILAPLLKRRGDRKKLRIWSAGCSTGEEPYSIAILLHEMIADLADWDIIIYGTDINIYFLKRGQEGIYRNWSFRGGTDWVKGKYFRREGTGRYVISPVLKRMVRFSYLNLGDDALAVPERGGEGLDVIFCRNVLMYFSPSRAKRVINRFYRALGEQGWLVLSPCESSFPVGSRFETVRFAGATLFRKGSFIAPVIPAGTVPATMKQCEADDSTLTTAWWQSFLQSVGGDDSGPAPEATAQVAPENEVRQATRDIDPWPEIQSLYEQGLYQETEARLLPLVADDGAEPGVDPGCGYLLLARINANRGELAKALRWCDKAVAQTKLDPAAHFLRATVLLEKGETEESVKALQRALYLDQDLIIVHFMLGNVLAGQGKAEAAYRSFSNAQRLLVNLPEMNILPESEGITAGRLRKVIQEMIDHKA